MLFIIGKLDFKLDKNLKIKGVFKQPIYLSCVVYKAC